MSCFIRHYELTRWSSRLIKEKEDEQKNKWSWEQLRAEDGGSDGENYEKTDPKSVAAVRRKKAAALRRELRQAKIEAVKVDRWRDNNEKIKLEKKM